MANVLITDIEVDAQKALSWLTGAEKNVTAAGPQAVSGLAALLGATATAVTAAGSAAASQGLNIALDAAVAKDFVSVWGAVQTFATELGIKF